MCMKDAIEGLCGKPHAPITIKIMIDPMSMMPYGDGGSTEICDRNHSYGFEDSIGSIMDELMKCMGKDEKVCPIEDKPEDKPLGEEEDEDKKCEK